MTKSIDENLDEMDEWPCQQLHGGRGTAIYSNVDGMCRHPECHPKNDDRLEKGTGGKIKASKLTLGK